VRRHWRTIGATVCRIASANGMREAAISEFQIGVDACRQHGRCHRKGSSARPAGSSRIRLHRLSPRRDGPDGEMNPAQFWETTLAINARSLLQVGVKAIEEANTIFDELIGDKVEPRRDFIEEHAHRQRGCLSHQAFHFAGSGVKVTR
jgi:hypothetical protein